MTTVVGQIVLDQEKLKYAGYPFEKSENQSNPSMLKVALKLGEPKVLKVCLDKYLSKKT